MKAKALLLLTLLAFVGLAPRSAEARVEVSFDFFYDTLSPYGDWIEVGDYGPCWRPRGIDADWRPYADGYWTYTDGGWTWVSYEEFGGIVYHYGRWVEVEEEGWCWVPDYDWAPAWVSWRSNDDYVGWAPLPPEARWRRDTGFSVWVDAHFDIGPARFNFCRVSDFGAPYLRPVIVNRFENVTIIQRTVNVTNITYYDDHDFGGVVHCGGPSYGYISRHAHRPIPALKLVHNTNITNINVRNVNVFNAEARGNQLVVAAPRVVAPPKDRARPNLVRSIPAARVSRGWSGVKDPAVAEGIRTQMRQESRGLTPESAPARRVQAAELEVVPRQADPNAPSSVRTARERSASGGKKSAAGGSAKPAPALPGAEKPVDPRTAERMLRDQAREPKAEKPAVETPAPRQAPKPVVKESPEAREPEKKKSSPGREATRAIPPAVVAPPSAVPERKDTPVDRPPVVRQRDASDADAKARAAAAARERSAAEAKARSAAIERQRAAEDAARRQKAQSDAAREMQRRQAVESPRREAPAPIQRMQPADASAQKAAAQAAARQRQAEALRQQAADNARRQQAAESARQSQMEAARRAQAARQQQQSAARQPVQRPAPPPAPTRSQGNAGGKKALSQEELEALKKSRGR